MLKNTDFYPSVTKRNSWSENTTMTGKKWTTDDQETFLSSLLPKYFEAHSKGTLSSEFWPYLFREWFVTFDNDPESSNMVPESGELTTEQREKQKERSKEQLVKERQVSFSVYIMPHFAFVDGLYRS
jgi:hypothetical protein